MSKYSGKYGTWRCIFCTVVLIVALLLPGCTTRPNEQGQTPAGTCQIKTTKLYKAESITGSRRDCGYIAKPVESHTHKLTQVAETAPTCTEPGKAAHYSCSGCGQLFSDESAGEAVSESELMIPAQGHRISNEHGFDGQNHWYLCVVCRADVTDTREVHQLQEGMCGVCGYKENVPTETAAPEATEPAETMQTTAPEATEPAETTQTTAPEATEPAETVEPTGSTISQPTEKSQDNAPEKNSWLLIVSVALVCFGAAVTTAVIILKMKKGRRHKENR